MEATGIIIKGLGGLYEVKLDGEPDKTVECRARGLFRHEGETVAVGDRCMVSLEPDGSGAVTRIAERKNLLIRPPVANLDTLFIVMAAARPEPSPFTADKLACIAEFNKIEPVFVINKSELDPPGAERLADIYRTAGFAAFVVSCAERTGLDALRAYIESLPAPGILAFSGASGVGKSTLMNTLFPELDLDTGEISRKNLRGRHTTRSVVLYPLGKRGSFVADTPGFTLLDFTRFDFFKLEDLPGTFREFAPCLGSCRYTRCSHTKEEGCAVLEAVRKGDVPRSRHESYLALRAELKEKHDHEYDKKIPGKA